MRNVGHSPSLRSLDTPQGMSFVDGWAAMYLAQVSIQHGYLEWGIKYYNATTAIRSYVIKLLRRINVFQLSVVGTGVTLGLGPVDTKAKANVIKMECAIPRDLVITRSPGLQMRIKRDMAHHPVVIQFADPICRAVEELLATSEDLYLKTLGDFGGWGQLFEGKEDAVVLNYTSEHAASIHKSKLERGVSSSGRLAIAGAGQRVSTWFWAEEEQLDDGYAIVRIGGHVPKTARLSHVGPWGNHDELVRCGGHPRQHR